MFDEDNVVLLSLADTFATTTTGLSTHQPSPGKTERHTPVLGCWRGVVVQEFEEWGEALWFPKPTPDDVVLLHARTAKRAAWAAQVAADAGLHCLVYRQVRVREGCLEAVEDPVDRGSLWDRPHARLDAFAAHSRGAGGAGG